MAKLREKKGALYKFKQMDGLSKSFIVGFIIAGVVLTGVTINFINVNHKAYLQSMEYEDPSVNFIVVPPKGWSATTPSRSGVEKTITDTTEGGIFDVKRYALKDEIVPVVLVEDVVSSETYGVSGSSYISMALRGYDSSKDRLYDQKYCEEYLGALLDKLDVEDIKYTNSQILDRGNFNGTFIQAEAIDNGVKVYYSQYQEIIGANVLTLTFGTTKSDMDGKEYINETLKYLQFKVLSDEEFVSDLISTKVENSDTDNETKKENGYKNNSSTSNNTEKESKEDNNEKSSNTLKTEDDNKNNSTDKDS